MLLAWRQLPRERWRKSCLRIGFSQAQRGKSTEFEVINKINKENCAFRARIAEDLPTVLEEIPR